jgi:molecular chaperone DnaK
MHTLRILNEPTAAALAYGHQRDLGQRIAVFDFGGGTFDVTVLIVRENLYEVVATGGDPYLGGDDMDTALANRLAMDFLQETRINVNDDPRARARLLAGAESIKVKLTSDETVEGKITDMAYGVGGFSIPLEFRMDRPKFESVIDPIVSSTIDKAESVLRSAGIAPDLINEVILVGGSTKVPLVQERVAAYFGKTPQVTIDPMEVVAIGAALQGNSLYGPADQQGVSVGVLMDVTSHSLGVHTAGGFVERLIPKNTTIPTEKTRVFGTSKDYQEVVDIKVCQGESKRYEDNIPVGELRLTGLKSAHRGVTKVEVTFLVDEDGLIQVSARDRDSGSATQATLRVVGVGDKEALDLPSGGD